MRKVAVLGRNKDRIQTVVQRLAEFLPSCEFSSELENPEAATVLALSVLDGPMFDDLRIILSARLAEVPNLFFFLDDIEMVEDAELIELVEKECFQGAKKYGYSKNNVFVVKGMASVGGGIQELSEVLLEHQGKAHFSSECKLPEYKCLKCNHVDNVPFLRCRVCNAPKHFSLRDRILRFLLGVGNE